MQVKIVLLYLINQLDYHRSINKFRQCLQLFKVSETIYLGQLKLLVFSTNLELNPTFHLSVIERSHTSITENAIRRKFDLQYVEYLKSKVSTYC